jgi:predicted glycosyltransferase involved in capsule biosynthesis
MKISFCTTSMDRLFHLEQTYVHNIESSKSLSNVEFVLLDYNSKDGLEDWVKENLSGYIESGRVVFVQTKEPRYWVAAHAKNIAHKVATGDILMNLDCDIFIPEGFCEYLDSAFSSGKRMVMAFESEDMYGNNGCAGLVAATRKDFYSVNGYDESIHLGWGYDDMNYQFRVRMQNNLELFTPPKICSCIPHPNEIRTKNCQLKQIEVTRDLSMNICEDAATSKNYVANSSIEWGRANITKNFKESFLI